LLSRVSNKIDKFGCSGGGREFRRRGLRVDGGGLGGGLGVGVVTHHPPKSIFQGTSPTQPFIVGLIKKFMIQNMGEFFMFKKKVILNSINIFVFSHLFDYNYLFFYKIEKI
jgi:hypothetical protein